MQPAHPPVSNASGATHGAVALCPGFSVYLDLVRFGAALLVFLEHARLSGLVASVPGMDHLAGEAVAIFFVLSGYIIASTTSAERGWRAFA